MFEMTSAPSATRKRRDHDRSGDAARAARPCSAAQEDQDDDDGEDRAETAFTSDTADRLFDEAGLLEGHVDLNRWIFGGDFAQLIIDDVEGFDVVRVLRLVDRQHEAGIAIQASHIVGRDEGRLRRT